MAAAPRLDVVIVSYRCEELLRECLASLLANRPDGAITVQVVDNASGDGTAEMVAREFPGVELTANTANLGFSRANNPALARGSAPYALVLNPDTKVPPGSLEALLELMDAHPEIGMAGPRLELSDGSFDHASRRSFPTPLSALGHFTGLGRRARAGRQLSAYRAPEVASGPVEAINGAFMLIRRAALEQVGAFDTRYWMYMEDLDLCYRFAQAGWTTWYEPSVTVVHIKAGTSGQHRSLRLNYAFHYGMFRFYRDHYARSRNPLLNGAVYVGIAAKLTISAIRSAAGRLTGSPRRAPHRSAARSTDGSRTGR
jgi:N-acetylglucosaminyl-diphospho-decaprenol L-rhamnosyltransferase